MLRKKCFFYISCPATLTIDLYTSILLPIVQRYVFTKLEVSTTFLFRENRRQESEGRGATLKAAPYRLHNNLRILLFVICHAANENDASEIHA